MSKDKRIISGNTLVGFCSLFILVSCNIAEVKNNSERYPAQQFSKEDMLIGSWAAEWNTPAEAYPVSAESAQFHMNGRVDFHEDGTVKIMAYGYNGCIFMSDTMTNEMRYELTGDTISLVGHNEDFGLPYRIVEMEPDQVQLLFMENIAVTLTR